MVSRFKYCPFCGESLPVLKPSADLDYKFCPFCGQKLFVGNPPKEDTKTDLAQATVVKEFTRQQVIESDLYNLVLKMCPDKDRLAGQLKQHLLRSYAAIRLAVENVPSVIIYKGKAEDMQPIVKAFYQSGSIIGLTCGDITADKFNLLAGKCSEAAQRIVAEVPRALWLGDNIISTTSNVRSENNRGCLVISDQAVYFVYEDQYKNAQWEIIPYYRIVNISLAAGGGVQLTFDSGLKRFSSGTGSGDQVFYTEIAACWREGRYRHKLKIICEQCHTSEEQPILEETVAKKCANCQGDLQIRLLCYS